MKIVVLLFVLIGVAVAEIESNFHREEECSKASGYCVLESECPNAVEKQDRDLCSGQKASGAICCRNFPDSQVNCNQMHNACVDGCVKNLNLGRKGCPSGKSCCVLV